MNEAAVASSGLASSGERLATAFVVLLRGAGLSISTSRLVAFVEALDTLGILESHPVYWAGRATLLSDPDDVDIFDSVFAVFWEQLEVLGGPLDDVGPQTILMVTDDSVPNGEGDALDSEGPSVQVRYSPTEVLRDADFAKCSARELDQLHGLMADMKFTAPSRPSHRLVATKHATRRPDIRRTIRSAIATGGEPIRIAHRARERRPRRLVLLVDVSGSMESYARALLRFAHAAVAGRTRVEAFTIGTRLTRVTRELKSHDPDAAMAAAGEVVPDWSGGTRLGTTMREFNDSWGVRGIARGAVVVVLSDGWDRGEPDVLAEQMRRLQLVAHKLVWVNPLKHTPGYEPLARGMAAALPFVDEFVEGHAYSSLERLVAVIVTGGDNAKPTKHWTNSLNSETGSEHA